GAVENVEGGLVDVSVLLGRAAGSVFLEVDVQRLGAPVLGLDVMPAEMLRPAVELEVLALDHPRHRPQPGKLVVEAVGALQRAHEHALLVRVMLLIAHIRSLCLRPRRRATQRAWLIMMSRKYLLHF